VAPLLASTEITAFHVVGGLLALWAVVLAGLGVLRDDFPGKGAGQTVVMAITTVLVLGAVGTAIGTAKDEPKGSSEGGKLTKVGPEGTRQNEGNGVVAPGTGSEAGQQPGGNAKPQPGQGTVKTHLISADPGGQLRFDKDTLEAPAGTVRITMNNPSPVPHDVSIEGPGGLDKKGPIVQKGGASEVEAPLKPGTYTYYCSVPGHRQAGMEGRLAVK
jgi:plastocyanin